VNGPDLSVAVERAFCDHFGHRRPSRASVSFLGVEPIEVLRFEPTPGERAYLSLGMSKRPMTAASEIAVGADGPRAELMLHIRDGSGQYDGVWRQLAVLAASPAVEGVVYVPGMTLDLGQPLAPGSRCTGAVVTESALAAIQTPEGTVVVLQVLPATSTELAWCRVHGTEALRERWTTQQIDLLDLARSAVALV
jgi:Suppressor of fused protein (SUFU)